jgi:peptidoglycan/LPS O-acetylase OafA/YrhL
MNNNMKFYRPEIDALKGLSIILVFLFHLELSLFKSGFLGVDIFFVISGYLIAQIFYQKNISLKIYLLGRIKRIFPAYFLVISFLSIVIFFLDPYESFSLSRDLLYSIPFLSNVWFSETIKDYFAQSYKSPILNFWSLSVEIQYYLFALIFFFLLKVNKKFYIYLLVILSLISLLLIQFGGNLKIRSPYIEEQIFFYNSPTFLNFYSFSGRIWEFLIGMFFFETTIKKNKKKIRFVTCGLILIFLSILFYEIKNFHPGLFTLLPVLGTGLILTNYKNDRYYDLFFKNKFFIFFGKLSYSLYLVHYPIIIFEKKYLNIDINFYLKIFIIILISTFLSYLSFKLFESPLRKKNNIKLSIVIIILLIFFSLLSNFFNFKSYGYQNDFNRINKSYNKILLKKYENLVSERDNLLKNLNEINTKKKKILIIGDSKAEDLFMLFQYNDDFETDLKQYQLLKYSFSNKKKFSDFIKKFDSYMKNNNVQKILISNHYDSFDFNVQLRQLLSFSKVAKMYNVPLFYVHGYPVFKQGENLNRGHYNILLKILSSHDHKLNLVEINRISYSLLDEFYLIKNSILENILGNNGFKFLNLFSYFCNIDNKSCEIVNDKFNSYYLDNFHLSTDGIKYFSKKLRNHIDIVN